MEQWAFLAMPFQFILDGIEAQAELADEQALNVMVESWVRAIVPCATAEFAKLNAVDCLNLGHFLMGDESGSIHSFMLAVLGVLLLPSIFLGFLDLGLLIIDALVGLNHRWEYLSNARVGNPFVHATVDALVVHVVLVAALDLLLCGVVIYNKFTKSNNEEKSMKIYSIRL